MGTAGESQDRASVWMSEGLGYVPVLCSPGRDILILWANVLKATQLGRGRAGLEPSQWVSASTCLEARWPLRR